MYHGICIYIRYACIRLKCFMCGNEIGAFGTLCRLVAIVNIDALYTQRTRVNPGKHNEKFPRVSLSSMLVKRFERKNPACVETTLKDYAGFGSSIIMIFSGSM